jgi:GNAT superfamily N-acetyltransferase
MDTLMWSLDVANREEVHPAIWEMAAKVETEHGIVCRPFRKRDLQNEVTKFMEVYNSAWERNWGFVPLTEPEVRHYAKNLKQVLSEDWAMIAERKDTGEVVGAALSLPDFNQVLAKVNGRLLPFGWIKALLAQRKIDAVRVFALGVKPEYQHTGVAARFYEMHFDSAERTPQKGGEMGWILETNKPMNRAMEGMGGKVARRYRVYERELDPQAEPTEVSDTETSRLPDRA